MDINPKYTSQTCSQCGYKDSRNRLSQDKFKCLECYCEINADINAAKNILAVGLCRDGLWNELDDITTEHLVLFSQVDFGAIRTLMREGLEIKRAKEKAEYLLFDWLVDRAAIHLKPGGTLTLLPAFHPHGSAFFCCKGIFQKVFNGPRAFSVEESTRLLLSDISELFPFNRGFSHMTIRFYQVIGEHSSERVSTFMSEYRLNMSSDAEKKSVQKNEETVRRMRQEKEALNFVTVTLVKEDE